MAKEYILQMNIQVNCTRCQDMINFFVFNYDLYLGSFFKLRKVNRSPLTGVVEYDVEGGKETLVRAYQSPSEVAKLLVELGLVEKDLFAGKNISMEFSEWKNYPKTDPNKYRKKVDKKK